MLELNKGNGKQQRNHKMITKIQISDKKHKRILKFTLNSNNPKI